MSLNSAMLAGVSGLAANSAALAAISQNIANVNTVGYKRTAGEFQTLVNSQTKSGGGYSAGGVAANTRLRAALADLAAARGVRFLAPPLRLCTDNAAMIAWAGIERFRAGHRDGLDLSARPRWPLDEASAPLLGAGKKGPKA